MTVNSHQPPIGFRIQLDRLIERTRARSQTAVNEMIAETLARQQQAAAQRNAQLDADFLARALDEKA